MSAYETMTNDERRTFNEILIQCAVDCHSGKPRTVIDEMARTSAVHSVCKRLSDEELEAMGDSAVEYCKGDCK